MTLSAHVSAEDIFAAAADHGLNLTQDRSAPTAPFGGRYSSLGLPHNALPEKGVPPADAYEVVSGELARDGKPVLNLASFVSTEVDDYAKRLFTEHYNINLADGDEYPSTINLHGRCVSMVADLWHAPTQQETGSSASAQQQQQGQQSSQPVRALGTATTGSSEAIMLGALALKKRWQERQKAAGKSIATPNLVVGANTQVCVPKAAKYFDIELREVPVSKESVYRLDTQKALEYVDENTIGVFVIAGSTYTGAIEPVKEMSERLDQLQAKTGLDVPIHVDAASGGFVLPFAWPELEWDFRVKRVASINSSGHKFGVAPVGLGWVVWRTPTHLPKELLFELNYLGSDQIDFNLNFSRPAAQMLVQYYNFIHLGREGYREMASSDLRNARLLARALEQSGYYEVVSENLKPAGSLGKLGAAVLDDSTPEFYAPSLPVVAFRWNEAVRQSHPRLQQRWVQTLLRTRGWIVPNYGLPAPLGQEEVLRVVVRNSMSEDMVVTLVEDLLEITESLLHDAEGNEAPLVNLATGNQPSGQPPTHAKHGGKGGKGKRTRHAHLYHPAGSAGTTHGHRTDTYHGYNRTC